MALRSLMSLAILLAGSTLSLASTPAGHDCIPWAEDFAAACQQANAQGKVVLLHFVCDNCSWCVKLEQNVFNQPTVGEAVGRCCVPVKVHAGKTPALAARYNVKQFPTDVFVTPAGLELTRTVSPQTPSNYIQMVNTVGTTAGVGLAVKNGANNTIAQVSNQANTYLTTTASSSAQTFQQSVNQAQQSAQQATQQSWQYAQDQANQLATNGQQAAQAAQHQTQAAADAAKEVLNRYSQPFQPAAAAAWQPPSFGGNAAPPSGINAAPSVVGTVQQQYAPNFAAQPAAPAPAVAAAPVNSVPATATPGAPPAIAANYPVALDGYCPVSLLSERKWKKGQQQFGARHRWRTYLFASEVEQQKFLADPDRYCPVIAGYDPVKFMQTGQLVDGRPTFSLTYKKQIYLFTDDTSLKTFWQNPSQFTEGLRQAMTRAEGHTLR